MTAPVPVIQLLPLGSALSPDELVAMSAMISACFGVRTELLAPMALPAVSHRPERGQYDADMLLEFLFDRLDPEILRVVGVTGADLFAEGRNFVFGYAHLRDRVAIISTLRLREAYWERPESEGLYRARIDKALTHELGHTFHAPHCGEARCVMHQVEFLWQLDQLEPAYCDPCRERVTRSLARSPRDPETLFELAGSYMRRRRFARAAAMYAQASSQAPDNAHYHNDHGVALLALGDRAAAAAAFEKAMALRPTSPYAFYNLGIVSRERGDAAAADRWFAEALDRDEDRRAGHRYLGILHQDYFHDPVRARRHLEKFRALGGEDAEVQRRLRALPHAVVDARHRDRAADSTMSTSPF